MKAVIVDLLNGQAAALCDDGRVVKLNDAGFTLGQVVEIHEKKRRRTPLWLRYASTAAAAALLLVGAGGGAAYAMPYGVVSLDVNPSIEYTINRFDYVLSVEGVNEDGKALVAQMDRRQLVNRRIDDALEASIQQLEAGNWLGGDSDEVLIAAGTKKEEHSARLMSRLETDLHQEREHLQVRAYTLSEEDVDAAHQAGMSAGRGRLVRELSQGEDFAPEDWANRPVGEIFHELEQGQRQRENMGPGTGQPRGGERERGMDAPAENFQTQPQAPEGFPEIQQTQPEERGAQAMPAFENREGFSAEAPRPEGGAMPGNDAPRENRNDNPGGGFQGGQPGGGDRGPGPGGMR